MINLEKIKSKYQSPAFKKTCPCTILPPSFFNFSESPPPLGEVIKINCTPLKRGGRSKLWRAYIFDLILVSIPSNLIRTGGGRGTRVFSLNRQNICYEWQYLATCHQQTLKNTRSWASDFLILYKKLKSTFNSKLLN